jgi:hypothetical protein
VVATGYTHLFGGVTSVNSGAIPPGAPGDIDIITCRDLRTKEVRRFRSNPAPFEDYEAFIRTGNWDYDSDRR